MALKRDTFSIDLDFISILYKFKDIVSKTFETLTLQTTTKVLLCVIRTKRLFKNSRMVVSVELNPSQVLVHPSVSISTDLTTVSRVTTCTNLGP